MIKKKKKLEMKLQRIYECNKNKQILNYLNIYNNLVITTYQFIYILIY